MTTRREIQRLKELVAERGAETAPCTACGNGVPLAPGELPAVRHILRWRPDETSEPPALPVCPACGREPEEGAVVVVKEIIVASRQEAPGDSPPPATGGPAGSLDPAEALTDFDLPDSPD